MTIPFLELLPTYTELKEEHDAAYRRVMESGWYLMGREVESFEAEFADYIGVGHCVAVGTGLDAIRIALEAHGIGAGDEVIVPAHTFIATWLAVSHIGALPVAVDVREDTANLDPDLLAAALTERTRAIVPVHLYGQPADMDPIRQFAYAHDLVVVEDAAQAHGARYKGRKCGTLGHSAAFSFYPGKNLGAFSDGGAITTDDDEVARKARMLRNYGSAKRYYHEIPGTNSRLDELQAAFLRVKLRKLDEWNARRAVIAAQYLAALGGVEATGGSGQGTGDRRQGAGGQAKMNARGEAPLPFKIQNSKFKIVPPTVPEWAQPVWHLFVVRHPQRDDLQKHLADQGIQTIIHYPIPPHLSGAYSDSRLLSPVSCPIAEQLAREVLSLPMGPHMTEEQVQAVAEAILCFGLSGPTPVSA